MSNLYKTINDTITAYYITNEDVLEESVKSQIRTAQAYTELWSNYESDSDYVHGTLSRLDKTLCKKSKIMTDYPLQLGPTPDLMSLVQKLERIDDTLLYYETTDLGFGPDGKALRKKWRKTKRRISKSIDKRIKGHIQFIKEWSKPRQEYLILGTGEIHNGIGQAICELIRYPGLIKYGIEKMKED